MSKRNPEVWSTKSGPSARFVSRGPKGLFAGPAIPAAIGRVEVWITTKGPVIKPTLRSTNGRFM
jgi:hypothetical protein